MQQPAKPSHKSGNYAFIDNQNLNLGIQRLGWKMNWRRFREFLQEEYGVDKAYMFIGYMPDYEDLYKQMHDHGFLVVLKPTLEMFKTEAKVEQEKQKALETGNDKPAVKGNVDAELVLYAIKEMPHYKKAIIVSGDGDFYSIAEYLKEKNKLLHIMVPNRQYSTLLKQFDEYVIRLDQFRRKLSYIQRPKK